MTFPYRALALDHQFKGVDDYAAFFKAHGYEQSGRVVTVKKSGGVVLKTTAAPTIEVKSLDPKSKLHIKGIANAKETDRYEEVVDPVGLEAGPFVKNPILLNQHNHREPLGQVTMLRPEENGTHFEAWVGAPELAPLTPCQVEARSLIAQRILRAVSIGFIPHKIRMPAYNERGEIVEPAVIERWELLELSIVSVPCNRGSLFDAGPGKGQDESGKKVWTFPGLGADDKFSSKSQKEKAMEKLEELMAKQLEASNSIAASLAALIEGQKGLQKSIDTLGSAKGEKPEEEEEEDDEEMKALKAKQTELETKLDDIAESQKSLVDALTKIAEKLAA